MVRPEIANHQNPGPAPTPADHVVSQTEPLDTLCDLAYKATKKNGEFVLPGFGKLVKQKRKARIGINPKTQQKIKIPAKTVVKFRVAKAAKDAVLGVKK